MLSPPITPSTQPLQQIQLTLEAADKAFSSGVYDSCVTQFARGATLDDTCGAIINGVSMLVHVCTFVNLLSKQPQPPALFREHATGLSQRSGKPLRSTH